ncbi:MAG: hypothetical protein KF678_06895 [Phycisphaeraceae bacterium]|nr:hypothetical protein [Phycisphaeraceae bacterium]
MIWVVYRDGLFYPSEPVPSDWKEGQRFTLLPDGLEPSDDPSDIARWESQMLQSGQLQFESGEREKFHNFMAEADRDAKESVRRSMESDR